LKKKCLHAYKLRRESESKLTKEERRKLRIARKLRRKKCKKSKIFKKKSRKKKKNN